jgi:GNAT superfamily N-acetyltransferase
MQRPDDDTFGGLGLRPATPADEPFLRQLFASTRADELALLNGNDYQKEAFIGMQFEGQKQQYALTYPHAQNNIILWNDAPIGRILLDRAERRITLIDITLLPTNRGAGIGTRLLRALLSEAAATGKPVKLRVWYDSPARELYQRLGFSAQNDDGVYCEMSWEPGL